MGNKEQVSFWILFLVFIAVSAFSQPPAKQQLPESGFNGPPKQESIGGKDSPQEIEKPSKGSLAPVPEVAPEKTQKKAPGNGTEAQKDSKKGWLTGDRIAVIASVVAFLQFLALVATIQTQRRSSRRQLRAYVFLESIRVNQFLGGRPPKVDADFENFGQTPAYEIVCQGDLIWGIFPPNNDFPASLVRPIESQGAVGPGSKFGQIAVSPRPMSVQELAEINAGRATIYYYGHVIYRDAFKKKHTTNFRLFYHKGKMNMCAEGNEAD